MKKNYLVGVDIGTGGCKTTVIDLDGNIVGSAAEEFPTYYPKFRWAEQDPLSWYEAFRDTMKSFLSKSGIRAERIESVCIDGQVHTPVFVNESWEILRPAIPWTDQRSIEQVKKLKKIIGKEKIIKITYNPPAPSYTLPQLLWVKENQPNIWKRMYKVLLVKDYIRGILTEPLWLTDHSDATATLMFDGNTFEWSELICSSVDIPLDMLPKLMPSSRIAGYVNKKASKETGLPEGIPVVYGGSDCSVEVLAAGTSLPDTCFVKLATSGAISVTLEKPFPDLLGRMNTYCLPTSQHSPGLWLTKTGTASCASALKWFRDVFCTEEVTVAKGMGTTAYEFFDRMAERVPVGSEGLFFHPYLIGELSPYFDPYLKGSFFGISLRHHKEHFCRAVLEGIVFSIKDSLHIFDEHAISINDVRLIGGGSNSRFWRQILCDVLGKNGFKPVTGDASFGSALLAGVGIGAFKDVNDAVSRCVHIDEVTKYSIKRHREYDRFFKIYQEIHDNLEDTAKLLHKIMQ